MMHDSWLGLVERVLRPARPDLERCLLEGERHRAAGQQLSERRLRALNDCRHRIEAARALVFEADDGLIPSVMTDLERQWLALARVDPDGGLMDLWARIAPGSWLDRKRWRDSNDGARLEAALALAADPAGVEAAEGAIHALGAALAAWGTPLGSTIRWRSFDAGADGETDCVSELLARPLNAAREVLGKRSAGPILLERALGLERGVREAARQRFPERPLLCQAIAHAACVDFCLRAAGLGDRPNPVTELCALWQTGYLLADRDAASVTLEIPPLP